MIKVFDTVKEFEDYSINGLKSGELCYVSEDKTAHFKTDNAELPSDNSVCPGPEYSELNLNVFSTYPGSNNKGFYYGISAQVGKTIEVFNPDHFNIAVGQGEMVVNPEDGSQFGPVILQNGVVASDNAGNPIEHIYLTLAPEWKYAYETYSFAIEYHNNSGLPLTGKIYYRIF